MLLFSSTVFFSKFYRFQEHYQSGKYTGSKKFCQRYQQIHLTKFAANQDIVDGERSKVDLDFGYLSLVIYSHTSTL